jgi:RHS repeat-associated protein
VTTFGYDAELATLTVNASALGTFTSAYDANHRRVKLTDPSSNTTRFRYGPGGRLPLEEKRTISGSTYTFDNVFFAGEPVAQVATDPSFGPIAYDLHTDRMGLVRKLSDTGGNSYARIISDAFGASNYAGGDYIVDNTTRPQPSWNWRYPGQYVDAGGAYNNGWREYIPELGQFNSVDPAHATSASSDFGPQAYAYAAGEPFDKVDPSGRVTHKPTMTPDSDYGYDAESNSFPGATNCTGRNDAQCNEAKRVLAGTSNSNDTTFVGWFGSIINGSNDGSNNGDNGDSNDPSGTNQKSPERSVGGDNGAGSSAVTTIAAVAARLMALGFTESQAYLIIATLGTAGADAILAMLPIIGFGSVIWILDDAIEGDLQSVGGHGEVSAGQRVCLSMAVAWYNSCIRSGRNPNYCMSMYTSQTYTCARTMPNPGGVQ